MKFGSEFEGPASFGAQVSQSRAVAFAAPKSFDSNALPVVQFADINFFMMSCQELSCD
jgi:hypothetical protein